MPDDARLPNWPRGMRQSLAAAYLGLSEATFRVQVASEVPPVQLTPGRAVWLRDDLDAYLDRKAGRSAAAAGDEWMQALGPR